MTIAFNAVFGVLPSYDAQALQPTLESAQGLVSMFWQESMEEEWHNTGIQVTAVCIPGKVSYPFKFGCPQTGETIVEVKGVLNPKFDVDSKDWKDAVYRIVKAVKVLLFQERVTLYFHQVDELIYIED